MVEPFVLDRGSAASKGLCPAASSSLCVCVCLEHQRNVDQQRYAHDQAMLEQQLNAERAAKALDADNARMMRDLDFRDVVERNQHEEQMQQNDLGTKISLYFCTAYLSVIPAI